MPILPKVGTRLLIGPQLKNGSVCSNQQIRRSWVRKRVTNPQGCLRGRLVCLQPVSPTEKILPYSFTSLKTHHIYFNVIIILLSSKLIMCKDLLSRGHSRLSRNLINNGTPSERNTFHCARCFHSVLVCLRICVEHKKLVSFFSEMYFYVRIFMEFSVVRLN